MPGVLVADIGGTATPTGITVSWTANNTWNTNNGTADGDNKLMNGYLDNNAANPDIPIDLAGISSYFQDGYSVYVYIGSDGNERTGTIENVGGATYSYSTNSQLGGTFPAAYAQTTDTGAGNPAANYAVFSGLSGDTQSFVFHRGSSNSGAHGIQIVGVPRPAQLAVFNGPSDADPQLGINGYWQDFDSFADGTTDLGDGSQMNGTSSVQGGALRLTTDGVAGGFASFNIPALANSSLGWSASFDLTIFDSVGANPPADGMSFNYGNFGFGELGSAEEGMAGVGGVSENLSFEIDTWMNFDAEQGVNIAEKVGGADSNLAFTNGPILNDDSTVSGSVTMSWDPTNGASFSTTGLLTNATFSNVPTTFAASDDFLFGLSGRVGGANETKLIDNLHIDLVADPEGVDFGQSPLGSTVTRTLALKNTGARALVIPAGGITVGPGFTVLNGAAAITVQSGEIYGLLVQFDATGDFTSDLTINADCNCNDPFVVKLSGGVPPIILGAKDIVVNAPAGGLSEPIEYGLTVTDETDPDPTLVCDPINGAQFPIGENQVHCVATDAAGNTSEAWFYVIVLSIQDPESMRTLSAVAVRGDAAPGAGGGKGGGKGGGASLPAGATIFNFESAYINESGNAIIQARLAGAGAADSALFTGNAGGLGDLIAAKGGTYSSFDQTAIADDDVASFSASLGSGETGHVTDGNLAAATGAVAPGTDDGVIKSLSQPASAGTNGLFSQAQLLIGSGNGPVSGQNDTSIWSSAVTAGPIAREGDPAAGSTGTYGHLSRRVVANEAGKIAFAGNLIGAGGNSAVWAGDPASLEIIAQRFDPAPGTTGTFTSFQGESIGGGGDVAIRAKLHIGPLTGDIASGNDDGIWRKNSSVSLGDYEQTTENGALPWTWDGSTWSVPGTANGNANTHARLTSPDIVVSAAGNVELSFSHRYSFEADWDAGGVLISVNSGPFVQVGAASFSQNGYTFDGLLGAHALGGGTGFNGDSADYATGTVTSVADLGNFNAGDTINVQFLAAFDQGATGNFNPNWQIESVQVSNTAGLELVAREGDVAPCLPSTDALFGRFESMFVADDGTVCFFAYLKGPGITSSNDGSFWRCSPDGVLHLVVREGDEANNTDAGIISTIVSVSCNNDGGVVYVVRLTNGIGGVVTNNNLGLFLDKNSELAAELVLRKNDKFELDGKERTITAIDFGPTTNGSGGTGGYGRIINDSGDVMIKLSLDSSLSGLFMLESDD